MKHDLQARSLRSVPTPRGGTPHVITVSGGKGGVGKTLIAVNLSILAARGGHRTLLVDLDPGLGNVDVHLRLSSRFSIEELALGECTPREAILRGPAGIDVLTGRSGSRRLASGDGPFLRLLLDTIERAANGYDLVVFDTGAGIGPSVVEAIRRATVTFVVTTPEPAAVTDAYALTKVLIGEGIVPPRLCVNRVRSRDDATRTATRIGTVCRKFLYRELTLAGWLTEDRACERSVVDQRPIALLDSGQPLEDLRALTANALSGLPAPAARKDALRRLRGARAS